MILAGKRDVTSSFFIDPSTARHQLTDADPVTGNAEYLGVESVWNHQNYYVNMQECSTAVRVTHFCLIVLAFCSCSPVASLRQLSVVLLARDAFVRTNRRAIAMMFVRPSVSLGRACVVITRCTLARI